MTVSTLRVAALCVVFCACGLPDTSPSDVAVATKHDAIIGGTTDTGDPQVFELAIVGDNMMEAGCTATLIAPHTLLTAAHCVDPRTIGATSITLYAMNKTNDATASENDYIPISLMQFHPSWNPTTLKNDIGIALLDTPPTGVTPKPWNTASIASLTGKAIRTAGYGANHGGTDPTGGGIRRQTNLTFRQIEAEIFFLGDMTAHGICHGDSGGPSFYTFDDGVERLVGVHSFTSDATCLDGADTRVDAYQSFIKTFITANEPATCDDDGKCKQGCQTPDIDCVCAADGQCTADCPDPGRDPDCPPDCATNGICSAQACPIADVDCVALGGECKSTTDCVSRLCSTDPQRTTTYCTVTCGSDGDCSGTPGMVCDSGSGHCQYAQVMTTSVGHFCTPVVSVCDNGQICAGPSTDAAYCSTACSSDADCSDGTSTCQTSFDGVKYCQEPPPSPILLPKLETVSESPAGGCTSAVGLLPVLALLMVRRRKKGLATASK